MCFSINKYILQKVKFGKRCHSVQNLLPPHFSESLKIKIYSTVILHVLLFYMSAKFGPSSEGMEEGD
jgi:hypothetical protein